MYMAKTHILEVCCLAVLLSFLKINLQLYVFQVRIFYPARYHKTGKIILSNIITFTLFRCTSFFSSVAFFARVPGGARVGWMKLKVAPM